MNEKRRPGEPVCETAGLDGQGSEELEFLIARIRGLDAFIASCFRKAAAFARLAEEHLIEARVLVGDLERLLDRRDPARRANGSDKDRRT